MSNMSDILRDPVWQFVGAFLAFVGFVTSIVLYWSQRRRKALSYEVISSNPLVSMREVARERIKILYEEKPVEDVHIVIVRIVNSGNVAITGQDYDRAISIGFGKTARILTADVVDKSPENFPASFHVREAEIVLDPVLFNSKDSLTLKALVSQLGEISVDGRIAGVKEINKLRGASERFNVFFWLFMILFFGGIFLSSITNNVLPFFLGGGVAFALLTLGLISELRSRKAFS
jgi:hypothetical protein